MKPTLVQHPPLSVLNARRAPPLALARVMASLASSVSPELHAHHLDHEDVSWSQTSPDHDWKRGQAAPTLSVIPREMVRLAKGTFRPY